MTESDNGFAWNLVATIYRGEFRHACRILEDFADVRATRYYNVVVAAADQPRNVVHALTERAVRQPEILDRIARLVPADVAFDFDGVDEFEVNTREVALAWGARLAGRSFCARLHRRGLKGCLDTPHEERLVDNLVLAVSAAAEYSGQVSFEDPDAVIEIETVDARAGMALLWREDLRSSPFLRTD